MIMPTMVAGGVGLVISESACGGCFGSGARPSGVACGGRAFDLAAWRFHPLRVSSALPACRAIRLHLGPQVESPAPRPGPCSTMVSRDQPSQPHVGRHCLTARKRVGLASPDNSDRHDSNAGRGPGSTCRQDCASARPSLEVVVATAVHTSSQERFWSDAQPRKLLRLEDEADEPSSRIVATRRLG
jgi:hypothetical protein